MARFAGMAEECRRVLIARHFGLDDPPTPCGACDVCADAAQWRATHLTERTSGTGPRERESGWRRGDWVRVDGRHLGQVIKVEGDGKRQRLVVESTSDLQRRTVDPRRQRVERVDR